MSQDVENIVDVYLSKSNFSDPDLLIVLRNFLADVDVREHEGGTYRIDKIDGSDVMIVLLPKGNVNTTGKGSGSEIIHANREDIPVFVAFLNTKDKTRLTFFRVTDIKENQTNDWKKEFYKLILDPTVYTLEQAPEDCVSLIAAQPGSKESDSGKPESDGPVTPHLALG